MLRCQVGNIVSGSRPPWYNFVVSTGKWIFLMQRNQDDFQDVQDVDRPAKVVEVVLFIITILSLFLRYVVGYFADLFILSHVLTLWVTVRQFAVQLKVNKMSASLVIQRRTGSKEPCRLTPSYTTAGGQHEIILKQYEDLQMLADLINSSMGRTMVPYLVEFLFGGAAYINPGLGSTNTFVRCSAAVYYGICLCNIILSAEICRMMDLAKVWLQKNQAKMKLGCDQIILLLDSITRNSVSITASGIFPINYSIITGAASALIAYFMIQLQSQSLGN